MINIKKTRDTNKGKESHSEDRTTNKDYSYIQHREGNVTSETKGKRKSQHREKTGWIKRSDFN